MLARVLGYVGAIAGPSISGTREMSRRGFSSTTRRAAKHGQSHYEALRLPRNATKQQVKAKFYELSKQYHPDAKTGNTAKFHEINDAYATLGDPGKRAQYDLSLSPAPHSSSHSHFHHSHSPTRYNPSSTSSFTPNDPWLRRNAQGQGPHRAWRPPSSQSPPRSGDEGPSYSPFGRRTPHGYRYTNSYDYGSNPNARKMDGGKRRMEEMKRERDRQNAAAGQGGVWKFMVTTLLVVSVISLSGGLAAESQGEWVLGRPRPCRVLASRGEAEGREGAEGDEGRID